MKKLLKYLAYFLVIVFVYYGTVYVNAIHTGTFRSGSIDGMSMYPTFTNNQGYFINKFSKPAENDIIAFYCHTDKCRNNIPEGIYFVKRIKSIHDGCYWVEGDNTKEMSFDSRWYGSLCSDELEIKGIVHKLPF